MADVVRLGHKGELSLPAQICKALDLKEGSELVVTIEDNAVVLRRKATRFSSYLDTLGRIVPRGGGDS